MDLVVRGGSVVTADGCTVADVGVADGRIVQIGGRMTAAQIIDAEDKLVLPGGVDMHVHLSPALVAEGDFWWADDFGSGSRAAAAGGVTTVGNITFPVRDEPVLDALARTTAEAEAASLADFVLHPVIVAAPDDPAALARDLAADGCVSVKVFTHMAGFTASPARYLGLIEAVARHDLTVMAHCEDPALGEYLSGLPAGESPGGSAGYYPPDSIEVAAVARMAEIAAATGARIYLVHLSSSRSADLALAARGRGARLLLETRPEYLLLTDDELAAAAGQQPGPGPGGRSPADLGRLWQAVSDGRFDAICTDHAPWREAPGKLPASGARSVRSGLSCLELSRSLLFMKGVLTGRMTLPQLAELTAAGPARAFGLYPAKGVIAVGSDADLAVFDPAVHWKYAGGQSRAEWTPFDGWTLTGRTLLTIRRGTITYRHDDGFAGGGGQRLRRPGDSSTQADKRARQPVS
ncbi:MAG TPA: amidohydrolase family protein [Streptosporangiaceae bacterium]|jgi:dihydropyrimidinase